MQQEKTITEQALTPEEAETFRFLMGKISRFRRDQTRIKPYKPRVKPRCNH